MAVLDDALTMKTFHASRVNVGVGAAEVHLAYTDENSAGRARPFVTNWKPGSDSWESPALKPTFVADTEPQHVDVGASVRVDQLGGTSQHYFRSLQSDAPGPEIAGLFWEQGLVSTSFTFLGPFRKLFTQGGPVRFRPPQPSIFPGVPAERVGGSGEIVAPFVDTATGQLLASITPAGISTPNATPVLIHDDQDRDWFFPVASKTSQGVKIYACDIKEGGTSIWRWNRIEGGGFEAGEVVATMDRSTDGQPLSGGTGGGQFAPGHWYVLDAEGGSGGGADRNLWALFEGAGEGNISSPER
jgi:hypothetical protein